MYTYGLLREGNTNKWITTANQVILVDALLWTIADYHMNEMASFSCMFESIVHNRLGSYAVWTPTFASLILSTTEEYVHCFTGRF